MIRVKGRYRNQRLELDQPLPLGEGTEVEIIVRVPNERTAEDQEWIMLGMERLEREWDNPEDAIYDDWKQLYGVESR